MSVSLSAERDRIQRQVEELEQTLSVNNGEVELQSSETEDGSDSEDEVEGVRQVSQDGTTEDVCVQSTGLLAQRDQIQRDVQNLEDVLGPHSPITVSEDEDSSDESELGLCLSVDSCLQMNLVYQQVVQETLDQLEILLTHNYTQQRELMSQLSGPIKEPPREVPASSYYQQPINMYLGRFLKPYFKDKLTGLGPPANQEAKEKSSRMTGCLDNNRLKIKRWESWQKTLLFHSVSRDHLKRLIQPKLSKVDYLSQKLSCAETDRQQLQEQIDGLEQEMDQLRGKEEEELTGDRYEQHDWQKISNIDFEGTRDAEDICCFWQNFLHPSINKSEWSQQEVELLKKVSEEHQERHWEVIAEELRTSRTAFMCLQMFQKFVSGSLRRSVWTSDEDDVLRELLDKMRIGNFIPYTQMSYFMEGRNPAQLIYRWNQVLDPSLKRGPWTPEEDQLLLQAVSRHGEKTWWKIRLEVHGRSDGSCRERYLDCLKEGLKRGPFDKQEQNLLLLLVRKHGVGHWSKIAAEIPQRNDAQCMRAWRSVSRKQVERTWRPKEAQRRRAQGRRSGGAAKRKIRMGLMRVKEEEEEEEEEDEEEEKEEEIVEYMETDDEEEKVDVVVPEQEEVQEEYIIPPLQDWIPPQRAPILDRLNFRRVASPPAGGGSASLAPPTRSTVLGQSGASERLGPPPAELSGCRRGDMMMVSPEELRANLQCLARAPNKFRPRPAAPSNQQLDYELQAAVTPWIGNLLIPTVAATRPPGRPRPISSSRVFLLLLQVLNVDAGGCKDMIERRRRSQRAPPAVMAPRATTVRGILQRHRGATGKQQLDQHHPLILEQLQQLLERQQRPLEAPTPPPNALILQPAPPPAGFPASTLSAPPPPPHGVTTASSWLLHNVPGSQRSASVGSSLTNQQSAPTTTTHPPRRSRQEEAQEGDPACCIQPEIQVIRTDPTWDRNRDLLLNLPPLTPPTYSASPPVGPPSVPPSVTPTNQHAASTSFCPPTRSFTDHSYTSPTSKHLDGAPRGRGRGRGTKREREEECEEEVFRGATPGQVQDGKRVRKPSRKGRALQEATVTKVEAKRRRTSSSAPRSHEAKTWSRPPQSGLHLGLSQSVWVMTPTGLVQIGPAGPPGLQVALVPSTPPPLPPIWRRGAHPLAPPPPLPHLRLIRPRPPAHPGPLTQLSGPSPSLLAPPPPPTVRADPAALQFDPSLMFQETPEAARDWLSGQGGVALAGSRLHTPYLPPFISTLSTLSALLRTRKSLMTASAQLLEPRPSKARPPASRPAPPVSPDRLQEEEEAQMAAVRHVVAERLSSSPAYQLLKARFLSCFTVPALLASMQPIKEELEAERDKEEQKEEDEEVAVLRRIKERGGARRKKSLLLCDITGAPANHFSGMGRPRPDETGEAQQDPGLLCALQGPPGTSAQTEGLTSESDGSQMSECPSTHR